MLRSTLRLSALLLLLLALTACGEPTEEEKNANNQANNANNDPNHHTSNNDHNANNANNAASNNANTANSSNNQGPNQANNSTSNNGQPCPTPNPCGGCNPLDSDPGDPCGPCADGTLACDGLDALTCTGARALNTCGGCTVLQANPGESCGSCEDGTLACDGTDALSCTGATTDCQNEALNCTDALDNDDDGLTDCDDDQCFDHTDCTPLAEICDNSTDDDGNGLADCQDPACAHHDACLDWSCVHFDLGSQLGRPLDTLLQHNSTDDFHNSCLTNMPDTVFKWTAPHDGLFTFDTTRAFGDLNLLQVSTEGACQPTTAFCGQGYWLEPFYKREQRSNVSLHLQQGQQILIVTEGYVLLGINANLLPQASAAVFYDRIFSHAAMRSTADFTADGTPELLVYIRDGLGSLISFLPAESTHALAQGRLWKHRTVLTGPGDAEIPAFTWQDFDINQDGHYDLMFADSVPVPAEATSTYVHYGPLSWDQEDWPIESYSVWRPPLAGGDLTGDGLEDVISMNPLTGRGEVHSNVSLSLLSDENVLIQLDFGLPGSYRPKIAVCDADGDQQDDILALDTRGIHLLPGPITPSTQPDEVLFLGPSPYSRTDSAVFSFSDINSDGLCDLVVSGTGLHQAENSSRSWGDVLAFYGPLNRPLLRENADLRIEATEADALWNFGSYSTIGDFNGDGAPDLAVSATLAYGNETSDMPGPGAHTHSERGLVLLFWGPWPGGSVVNASQPARIISALGGSAGNGTPDPPTFGSILAAGDFDGDGFSDLAISDRSWINLAVLSGRHLTQETFGRGFVP